MVLVPLKLVGTVPGGALDEPAKADAADLGVGGLLVFAGDVCCCDGTAAFADLGALEALLLPADGAATMRGLEADDGDVDLEAGMPNRA